MNSSNVTQPTGPQVVALSSMDTLVLISFCVIFVVGTVGNGLVIYVTGIRMKRTVNSVWFLNLAIADFLFTAFLIFMIIYISHGYHWSFGDGLCKLGILLSTINMFASVFLLTSISLDRCLSIWVVVWAQNKRTPRKAQVACVVIWLVALGCSLPYSIARQVMLYKGKLVCAFSHSTDVRTLVISRFVFGCLLPFLVITISYIAIGVRIKRLQRGRQLRSLRLMIGIVLAFFFCWFPYHAFQIVELHAGRNQYLISIVKIGSKLTTILAFLNSCLNPILYVFMCDEFHKKLNISLCHVLESALAEDQLSLPTSRSMSLNLSLRFPRKSVSTERKNTTSSITADNIINPEEQALNHH